MKRTIKEVRMLLKELDEKYGIKTSDVEIKLNRRYTRTLGVCFTKGKEVVKFEFSELFFNLDYETFTQIIKHEWSHAYDKIVYNGKGHGKTFKMTCDMVDLDYETFTQIIKHEWSHAYDKIVYNGKGHGKTFKMTCDMVECN